MIKFAAALQTACWLTASPAPPSPCTTRYG